jgi:hypothetical protein
MLRHVWGSTGCSVQRASATHRLVNTHKLLKRSPPLAADSCSADQKRALHYRTHSQRAPIYNVLSQLSSSSYYNLVFKIRSNTLSSFTILNGSNDDVLRSILKLFWSSSIVEFQNEITTVRDFALLLSSVKGTYCCARWKGLIQIPGFILKLNHGLSLEK